MENYKERREEVEHIADSYGLEAQMRKTVKELSELIQTMSPVRKTEEALIPDSVGEIADFMAALTVIEKITMRLHQERICNQNTKSLFDFSYVPDTVEKDKEDEYGQSLLDAEIDLVSNAYAFLPYQFYTFCKDQLDKEHLFSTPGHVYSFKLKPGETIKVEAH